MANIERKTFIGISKAHCATNYLSRKVTVCLLAHDEVIRRQMRHNIMRVRDPNCQWNIFTVVCCKCRVSNSWLPKCKDLNILDSIVCLPDMSIQ
jgi:hypothetical protein